MFKGFTLQYLHSMIAFDTEYKSVKFMLNQTQVEVESEMTHDDVEIKHKLKSPLSLVDSLLTKTDLRFLKSFVTPRLYYLYHKREGCYHELSREDLMLLVKNLLELSTRVRISINVVESVLKELTFDVKTSQAGYPSFSNSHVVFSNGVIDLQTREFFGFTPQVFCLNKVSFPYDPEMKDCPRFLDFLDAFCEGHEDRKVYIRVMSHLILTSKHPVSVLPLLVWPRSFWKEPVHPPFKPHPGRAFRSHYYT